MKSIIAFIVFGLIFLSIIVMVVIYFSYKGVRKLKEEVEESYYRNQRMKEQKERNPFGNDYFKSATTTKKAQPKREKTETYQEQLKKDKNPFGDDYFKSEAEAKAEKAQKAQKEQAKKENTARSKPADSGVTIVDEREDKRKIFDHTDGEYVEFEEV